MTTTQTGLSSLTPRQPHGFVPEPLVRRELPPDGVPSGPLFIAPLEEHR